MRTRHIHIGLVMSLALCELPASADTAGLKQWATDGWKAKLPANWTLVRHQRAGLDKHLGRWRFQSPSGNLKLYVSVSPDPGGDMQKLAETNLARLTERISGVKFHKKDITADGYVALVEGEMVRKTNKYSYVAYRSLTRDAAQKLIYALTLAAAGSRLDVFNPLVQQISESFEPVAPARAQ